MSGEPLAPPPALPAVAEAHDRAVALVAHAWAAAGNPAPATFARC